MRSAKLELYNLKDDLGEQNDVAAQYPEKVKELAAKLSTKLREWNSPMPSYRGSGKTVPMPDNL